MTSVFLLKLFFIVSRTSLFEYLFWFQTILLYYLTFNARRIYIFLVKNGCIMLKKINLDHHIPETYACKVHGLLKLPFRSQLVYFRKTIFFKVLAYIYIMINDSNEGICVEF